MVGKMIVSKMDKYETVITFRLFKNEREEINKYVRHSKDIDGFCKYESPSHFCRCAIINLIKTERSKTHIKQGRPKKHNDGS